MAYAILSVKVFTDEKVIFLRLSHIPWKELKYVLWLPLYLLAFVLIERLPTNGYWATQLPLDSRIPFCEWFVLFYCVWYPLLVAAGLYLLFRDTPWRFGTVPVYGPVPYCGGASRRWRP